MPSQNPVTISPALQMTFFTDGYVYMSGGAGIYDSSVSNGQTSYSTSDVSGVVWGYIIVAPPLQTVPAKVSAIPGPKSIKFG